MKNWGQYVGKTYSRLLILDHSLCDKHIRWFRCLCSCGNYKLIRASSILDRVTKSCGCLHRERAAKAMRKTMFKHGESIKKNFSPEYNTWLSLRARCVSKMPKTHKNYAARGISVCKRWGNFKNFLKDMGQRPKGRYTIDRINNNGNYEPGNCRWATYKEQAQNRRRPNGY